MTKKEFDLRASGKAILTIIRDDYWNKLYNISPELTCKCHDDHICQQCFESDNDDNTTTL
jgi:hypothetical protein